MARVAGLTGTIGSGKSTVARMFRDLGAYVIDADKIAHQVILPGRPAYEELIKTFGEDILLPDGHIDRKRLAEKAFSSEELRKLLNSITHPRIGEEIMRRLQESAKKFDRIILDVPLLIEANMDSWLRPVIMVYAPEEICLERIIKRDGVSREHAIARLRAQMSPEEKKKRADFVIDNSGDLERTRRQVLEIWDKIWDFPQGLVI